MYLQPFYENVCLVSHMSNFGISLFRQTHSFAAMPIFTKLLGIRLSVTSLITRPGTHAIDCDLWTQSVSDFANTAILHVLTAKSTEIRDLSDPTPPFAIFLRDETRDLQLHTSKRACWWFQWMFDAVDRSNRASMIEL